MAYDRDELLTKLARALAQNPGSSMKELAEEAGISKASLHRIYSTRDSLCQTLVEHTTHILVDLMELLRREHHDFDGELKELIAFYVKHDAFVLFIGREAFVQMIDEAVWDSCDEALASFFRGGKEAGAWRADFSSEEMRDIFRSLVVGILEHNLWDGKYGKTAEKLIYRALLGGIASK